MGGLVRAFVLHLAQRYGFEEVKSWYFEVWNEPNLEYFFDGKMEDYFKLYEFSAKAVKEVCPKFRVGGPATAGCKWINEFIKFCSSRNIQVDFASSHTYGANGWFI